LRYKIDLRFSAIATVELVADSPAAAREAALQMNLADLARPGHADISQFDVAVREITSTASLSHGADDTQDPEAASKPRPSGWYRPV